MKTICVTHNEEFNGQKNKAKSPKSSNRFGNDGKIGLTNHDTISNSNLVEKRQRI